VLCSEGGNASNKRGSEFGRLLHVGECGPLDGLREKAGQDSIYLGAIKKKPEIFVPIVLVERCMKQSVKLSLKGIAASPGIVTGKAYRL